MRYDFPLATPGQRIGLLGGSFDPAHEGHRHITLAALKHFDLDRVWWMLSPGNPLKTRGPAPIEKRLERAREVMQHPRVDITTVEQHLGTRYTAQTIAALQAHYPHVQFTWLMGADNLAQIHLWQDWHAIMKSVPIGVLARPGSRLDGRTSVAARTYANARISRQNRRLLSYMAAPAWCFINISMSDLSSTEIRATSAWNRRGASC